MRWMLAALIACPPPAFAAVLERIPSMELRAPSISFQTPQLAMPSVPLTAALSMTPLLAAPAIAAAPIPVTAAVATPIDALGALTAFSRSVRAQSVTPTQALATTFDGSLSAASAPDPVQGPDSAKTPAPLSPAPKTPAQRMKAAAPNLLTFSNMASGLTAMLLATDAHFLAAGIFILLANLFDALDGRAARALKVNNPLGTDMDSLADVVSFGAAPAILIFKAALLPTFGWWGFPVAAAFAAAGLYRLARFNVGAHAEKSGAVPAKSNDSFTGLPIPGGAGVIVALTMALAAIPAAAVAPVAVIATLLTAAAMVSRLPYPAFKTGGAKALIAPALVASTAVTALAALGLPAFIPAAVFGLYLASGPLIALTKRY